MTRPTILAFILLPLAACNSVSSEAEAELSYVGLNGAIERSIGLGFDGFNAADSANIAPQEGEGDVSGTLIISGQVDQGSSDNKGMRLEMLMDDYADLIDVDADEDSEFAVTYWTDPEDQPKLDMQLKDIPDGTVDGTLMGTFEMEGDLEGQVILDLNLSGAIEDDGDGGTQRVAGGTRVIGLATGPSGGEYEVDLEI